MRPVLLLSSKKTTRPFVIIVQSGQPGTSKPLAFGVLGKHWQGRPFALQYLTIFPESTDSWPGSGVSSSLPGRVMASNLAWYSSRSCFVQRISFPPCHHPHGILVPVCESKAGPAHPIPGVPHEFTPGQCLLLSTYGTYLIAGFHHITSINPSQVL